MKKTRTNNSIGIKKFRTIFGLLVTIFALFFNGQTNAQTYFDMSSSNYSQNFNGITTLPTNFSLVGVQATGTIPSATRTTTASTNALAIVASGAAVGIDAATSTRLVFLTTGATANSTAIASDLNLNFTGRTAGNLSYDASTIFNSTGDRVGSLRVYYSLDNTAWTELTGTNLPYVATNNVAGSGSVSIALPSALNNQATVKLRFYYHNGNAAGTAGSRPRIGIDNLSVTSTAASGPTITWAPTSLTGFSATAPAASGSQISQVSGTSLSPAAGNITVTAPTNFQVFDDQTTFSWVTSYTIPYSGGALALTDVSARIAPGAPAGAVSGNVTAAGGGATTSNLAVSGTVIGPVVTTSAATLVKFYANHLNASQGKTFNVSGSNLNADLIVSAPAGYTLALDAAFTSPSATINLTPSSGTVASTPIFVRMTGATVGTFSGNITIASNLATTQNTALTGQVYASAVPFTAGNYVVTAVGETGSGALTSASQAIFLREYTSGGTLVQTVLAPVSLQGSNQPITQSGTSTSEGYMNLSPDGKYLTFAGYVGNPITTTAITGTTSLANPRLIARVDYTGAFNTSTQINDGFSGANIRSAVTLDGNNFWTSGAGGTGITGGGVRYSALGSSGASVQVSNGNSGNTRVANIANSQLFVSAGAGTQGILSVGTGLPTTTGQSNTLRATITGNDPSAFKFMDRDGTAPGNDVMYVASLTAQGIQKFSSTDGGTTWTARGVYDAAGLTYRDISVEESGGNVIITAVVGAANNNSIIRFTDVSIWNANINVPSAPTTIVPAVGTEVFLKGISLAPVLVLTPEVDHTFTSPTPSTAPQGSINKALYRIQCDVAVGAAILSGVTVQTAGAYGASDVINFKLILSNDATLDAGDATLATISSSTGPGQTLAFTGLGQNLAIGTRYLFVTASISGCAPISNTINITSTPLTAITYTDLTTVKTGTPAAGGTYTISAGNLADVTSLAATSGTPQVSVSWVNPPSCITEVIVVAHTAPINGTPTGTYTGNTNYAAAPAFPGGGKVVYNGLTSPQSITGLTVGTQYYFKVFVRFNTDYSLGVQTTATPALVNYYSRSSGVLTDPIWTLTPTGGTPATIASLGGMLADRGLVIQTGHTVQLDASSQNARELVVNTGATFTATGTGPGDNKFLNIHGNVTNNGTIGTGTTYNPICFNIEGVSTTFSGTGVTNVARIRKNTNLNATSNLIINSNVNIRFAGDGAIYNNTDNTTFNVTVNSGRTLNLADALGGLSISGTDGLTGGTRNGTITINGTVTVGGTTYARTANATAVASIVINSGGILNTKNLIVNTSTGNGFGFTINGNLNVSGTLNNVAGAFAPAVGGNINVSGIVLVTAGSFNPNNKLTLTSTATATGMIDGSGAGTIIGDVTVQRRVVQATPTSNTDHYLSSPVAMVGTVSSNYNDNFPVVGNPAGYVYNSNPNVTQPSVFPSTWTWDETQVNSTIPGWTGAGGTTLLAGQGFSAKIPGTKIIDIKGAPNNGAISRTVTYTDNGLNLVGNPYPSPINFNSFATANTSTILPVLYIWNPASNSYASYNGSIWVNNPAGALASDVIAHSQSFFVFAKPAVAPSGSVNFTNSMRTTTQAANFFATPEGLIRLEVSSNGYTDEAVVMTNADATENYDEQVDAKKLLNAMNPNILAFTLSADNTPLAINALDKFNTEQVIPVQLVAPNAGEVNIKLNLADLQERYENIYLEDATLGTFVDLKARGSYTAAVSAGNSGSRFFLHFEKPSIAKSVNELGVYAANSTVFVNIPSQSNGTIEVIDLVGKTIYASNFAGKSGRVAFEIPNAVYGSYIVKLTSNGKVVNQKVILNQ
ncbi:MAG: T9SS type A sorting domain-containing protein [Bacteroidota bacterium]|jgi:hypothetical protein